MNAACISIQITSLAWCRKQTHFTWLVYRSSPPGNIRLTTRHRASEVLVRLVDGFVFIHVPPVHLEARTIKDVVFQL